MRNLKFRGQREDRKEFVFGEFIRTTSGWMITDYDSIDMHSSNGESMLGNLKATRIIKETLGQFTGLQDKHGVDIYEGDIVNLHIFTQEIGLSMGVSEGEKEFKGFICFEEFGLAFKESLDDEEWFYLVYSPGMLHEESFEVIGNIHDNPDLLNNQ